MSWLKIWGGINLHFSYCAANILQPKINMKPDITLTGYDDYTIVVRGLDKQGNEYKDEFVIRVK